MSCTDYLQDTRDFLPVEYSNLIRHFIIVRPPCCLRRHAKMVHIVSPRCLTTRIRSFDASGKREFSCEQHWATESHPEDFLVKPSSPENKEGGRRGRAIGANRTDSAVAPAEPAELLVAITGGMRKEEEEEREEESLGINAFRGLNPPSLLARLLFLEFRWGPRQP